MEMGVFDVEKIKTLHTVCLHAVNLLSNISLFETMFLSIGLFEIISEMPTM